MIKQFFISGLAFATALSASGQFNPGDLAVLRLGGGAETLGTAGLLLVSKRFRSGRSR